MIVTVEISKDQLIMLVQDHVSRLLGPHVDVATAGVDIRVIRDHTSSDNKMMDIKIIMKATADDRLA